MNAQRLEAFLARLYTDAEARRAFLADPYAATARARLDQAASDALAAIDLTGLELAAKSFEQKRLHRRSCSRGWPRRLRALVLGGCTELARIIHERAHGCPNG